MTDPDVYNTLNILKERIKVLNGRGCLLKSPELSDVDGKVSHVAGQFYIVNGNALCLSVGSIQATVNNKLTEHDTHITVFYGIKMLTTNVIKDIIDDALSNPGRFMSGPRSKRTVGGEKKRKTHKKYSVRHLIRLRTSSESASFNKFVK